MHNNYYFLRQLSFRLNTDLAGSFFQKAYSQDKDELIIRLTKNESDFYIKAHLSPSFCCLSFPDSHHRARKNSVDLFTELEGKSVTGIRQFLNERCFGIQFGDQMLLFKLYGNRSNLALWDGQSVSELFRNKLKKDKDLNPEHLDRKLDQSYIFFEKEEGDYKILYPTFGKIIEEALNKAEYWDKSIPEKWELIQDILKELNRGIFYIPTTHPYFLSLLPTDRTCEKFNDPVRALNHFYRQYQTSGILESERKRIIVVMQKQLARSEKYIRQTQDKLKDLGKGMSYREVADLLMANLHIIPAGSKAITVSNFFNEDKPITISLKPELSAQDNAANLYRKAKNQHLERNKLQENIDERQSRFLQDIEQLNSIKDAADINELRELVKESGLSEVSSDKRSPALPYREVEYSGYAIWIGRNAKANDTMLRISGHKNDLWLHAKDGSGSHVLIKQQAGRTIPAPVKERAAELAAWYSSRKTDSLCPVIITPRKYVRKRKGDPPGMVMVDREEEVLLVKPSP